MPITSGAPAHGNPAHLLPPSWTSVISAWLAEDTPSFDYGGFVVGAAPATARLLAKSPGILAGVPFVDEIFKQLDCKVEWLVKEGELVGQNGKQHVATVTGPTRNLLLGERVALNVIARCSGIATKSDSLLQLLRKAGYKNTLAGTRKTTPGFRLVEKYGMLVGGCDPHRQDLSTMTMLKDNHIWACDNNISTAVLAAKSAGGFAIKVEVECQSLDEANQAIEAGADVVMLDNFTPGDMKEAARKIKEKYGGGVRGPLVEVSGGLTEENVRDYVSDDVDVISSSSIHQGTKHVDFSLKIVPKGVEGKDGKGESVAT
ncbi:nicotinate-nucleotide pyrophosphorylase [Aureobasidium pullulans]|uniref:Nicotinate-nucleotide pyrophosphorylase [carboxylating] n=1 Tax=Aureobasidium pullulans TaxID=5580 RepID=A0A4S9DT08_AURPU|nr:nicotinate-nucleotide pyrophosphorylase [Aureobasidium pullulans]THX63683.1 nicotinate-nucleotide pyrophosphorylase [Aureobasidium pullulans]THX97136.1 nicotinate-nucleotide pyrophosphorylase [Aureobasidium pullulans]